MKKSLVILISLGLIILLSVSFVSASWFGDIWKKITGKTTENNTNQTGCTDECSSNGAKQCDGNGYKTCGNYDADSCLEWNAITSCLSSETCVQGACVANTYTCDDSDGGKAYNVKGNVIAKSPTSDINVTDLCGSSNVLIEYFCNPDKTQSGETYTCPNGCSNGACSSSTTTNQTNTTTTNQNNVCTDSDGGKNYNVKGNVVASSPLPGYTGNVYDYCKTDGTNALAEYFCDSTTNLLTAQHYVCPNGCSNGACVSGTTTNQTNATTSTTTSAGSTTTTTVVSASGAGGGGGSTSTISKISEGVFEEKTIIEKTEGTTRITSETKTITDTAGNEVKIEIKTEIKEDGTTIIKEERKFFNKEGTLIKLKNIIENDGVNIKIKREVEIEGQKIESEIEIGEEFEEDGVKLKAKLSDGSEQEIKIMPDRASEIAIERLKTKNFEIELKEVGEENNLKAVYIAQVDDTGRLLGLFKVKIKSKAQIDSETGEILNLERQWWNFLISKNLEDSQGLLNQTNFTNRTFD